MPHKVFVISTPIEGLEYRAYTTQDKNWLLDMLVETGAFTLEDLKIKEIDLTKDEKSKELHNLHLMAFND